MKLNNNLYEKIAIKIKTLRFKNNWTQDDLSEKSGMSINCISNIENMKEDIKLSSLISISNAFNVSIIELFVN